MQKDYTPSSSKGISLEENRELLKRLKKKRDKTLNKKCLLEERLAHELSEMELRIANLRDEIARKSQKLQQLDAMYGSAAKEFTEMLVHATAGSILKVANSKSIAQNSDLQLVNGIGSRVEEILQQAKVLTLEDLAEQDTERLQAILLAASPYLRLIDPSSWPQQASSLLQKSDVA